MRREKVHVTVYCGQWPYTGHRFDLGILSPMNLRAALKTPSDLFEKLKRDARILQDQVSSDGLFNFVVTAHSLHDWIQKDPNAPKSAKSALTTHRASELLKICRDIANANKHFELNTSSKNKSVTRVVESKSGFGIGRYGAGPFGIGEESIEITLQDGAAFNLLQFSKDVEKAWSRFFAKHGM